MFPHIFFRIVSTFSLLWAKIWMLGFTPDYRKSNPTPLCSSPVVVVVKCSSTWVSMWACFCLLAPKIDVYPCEFIHVPLVHGVHTSWLHVHVFKYHLIYSIIIQILLYTGFIKAHWGRCLSDMEFYFVETMEKLKMLLGSQFTCFVSCWKLLMPRVLYHSDHLDVEIMCFLTWFR